MSASRGYPALDRGSKGLWCGAGYDTAEHDPHADGSRARVGVVPKYKGLNTHKRALKNKEKFAGCTVHYVTIKLDSGKIILQKKVKIKKKDTLNSLKKKVLKKEHWLYPAAIRKIFS